MLLQVAVVPSTVRKVLSVEGLLDDDK